LLILLGCSAAHYCVAAANSLFQFALEAGSLHAALQSFSAQSGVQLLYEQQLVAEQRAPAVRGRLSCASALERLLRNTGLRWRFIDDVTVAIYRPTVAAGAEPDAAVALEVPRRAAGGEVVALNDIDVIEDQRSLASASSNSAFGFNKPLLETPRSVSFISEEVIDAFGLSVVEDLARVAPGVFTTTRFGIQGSVDVRNVPADTYFRGMKRLTLQGHGRSVLAAMDSIEVVAGPPSPLYGMGKIGGYTNVVPKSGRAVTGKYMSETQAYVQGIAGRYGRREVSFGIGGPLSMLDEHGRQGGYYVFGLVEDSNSYAEGVPVKQVVLQAASNIDDAVGRLRLESGLSFQESRTAGALIGRLTQDLVDSGRYISGSPLANLDLNGNGSIDWLEMQRASPVAGRLSANNQPLMQTWAWPTDAAGHPLALSQFPKISGIPQTMYDYLNAHPEADPGGLLRAQGVGGPLPIGGAVPVGMVLDPRTVRYTTLNPRHASAYERESQAQFVTAYADLIDDANPAFTIKNQLFFDGMKQHKISDQPLHLIQNVHVLEDKLTLGLQFSGLPYWLRINSLFSLNARNTVSSGSTTNPASDYGNHRTDAMAPNWSDTPGGLTANTTFDASSFPWGSIYRTEYSEFGGGALFDIDLFSDTNLLVGGRIDRSHARNTNFAGRFNVNTGTSANPGAYLTTDDTAEAWDGGPSWSISLSRTVPHGLHPYVTVARSSIMLDGNNNSLSSAVIRAGHVGSASLQEAGLKASLLRDRLSLAASVFRQGRVEVSDDDSVDLLNAYATATTTRGWQAEVKWLPLRHWLLSVYAQKEVTEYTPNVGGTLQVDARSLGFRDVLDSQGNIVYPAEAFLYGGRVRIILPDNMPEYRKKQGNPDTQMGLNSIIHLGLGWGFTFKANYLSSTCAGRLCLTVLPQSYVYDAGALWESAHWNLKFDVFNLTDKHYFRARTGDTLGDVIAQAMPGRRWQLTAKYNF
jgi:iron complex outermembrane receptor protein